MNTSKHRPRFLKRLGILIVICAAAALSGCTSTVKLNYVNWEVEFNKGTSELDKAVAMDSIRRYILQTLSTQKDSGLYLRRITFNYGNLVDRDRAPIGVELRFSEAGTTVTVPPKPGGGGPGQGFHPPSFPNIPNVRNFTNLGVKL